ncbi:MAG: hypothetical protein IKJ63_04915 [Clostridia bacterium]|nr:hypothetical protein [Clostridia bacterium]
MDNIKVTLNLEPTEEYQKAKTDLFQALYSFSKLSDRQKEQLAKEIFGASQVNFVIKIMQGFNG